MTAKEVIALLREAKKLGVRALKVACDGDVEVDFGDDRPKADRPLDLSELESLKRDINASMQRHVLDAAVEMGLTEPKVRVPREEQVPTPEQAAAAEAREAELDLHWSSGNDGVTLSAKQSAS